MKDEIVTIDDLCISIYDENNKKIEINISNFLNKTIKQDLKLLMFYTVEDSKLVLRKKIIINNEDVDLSKYIDKTILLKTKIKTFNKLKDTKEYVEGKPKIIELGKFIVIAKNIISPTEDDNLFQKVEECNVCNYSADFWDDCIGKDNLKSIYKKYSNENEETLKKIYIDNGLLKIYYYMTIESARINNTNRIAGKVSAMCSYISVKKIFNEYFENNKINYEISNPNVFIKDNNIEYDALVIKKNSNNNEKFLFDEDDVISTIEIKTSGFFTNREELKTSNKTNGFIKYLKDEKIDKKQHIYISIYESFGSRNTSIHYYEYLFSNLSSLKKEGYYGIFCGTKKDQDCFLIPYEYDLNEILNEIFYKTR